MTTTNILHESAIWESISNHTELIERIVLFESDKSGEFNRLEIRMAWDYSDVRANPQTLYKLWINKFLEMPFGKSGSTNNYCLTDLDKTKEILAEYLKHQEVSTRTESEAETPTDLFDIITGYDDIKEIIILSLESNEPVHIMLIGPPASAKSLFLMELERLPDTRFALGGSSSRVGIRELLYETPKILIIDEIDKINDSKDLSSLLSWTEGGRVVTSIHNKYVDIKGKGWVFAAGNSDKRLPPEFKSRFLIFHLKEYSKKDYENIVYNLLVNREGVEPELAIYIAKKTSALSKDVRDAIKIARLSKSKEMVTKLLITMEKYS